MYPWVGSATLDPYPPQPWNTANRNTNLGIPASAPAMLPLQAGRNQTEFLPS